MPMGRSALRKFNAAVINVPYLDMGEDGKSQRVWATFKLSNYQGGFCKRKVKRVVRKWLQHKLDKKIDIQELRKVLSRAHYLAANDVPQ